MSFAINRQGKKNNENKYIQTNKQTERRIIHYNKFIRKILLKYWQNFFFTPVTE